jgi:hypothetical protein
LFFTETSEDHWSLYLDYITSVLRLVDSGSAEVSLTSGQEFILGQQQKFPRTRGPFLAEIELQARTLARSSGSGCDEGELCRLLVAYFAKFGTKPACALDLKLYLPSVGSESKQRFFDEAFKLIDLDDDRQAPKSVSFDPPMMK